MFEYHGQPHVFEPLTMEDWSAIKASGQGGEFNCLPAVVINANGRRILKGQSISLLRYYGICYGYYDPKNWKQNRLID